MGLLAGIKFGIGCICGTIVAIVVGVVLLLLFLKILTWPFSG
jgi:hypothetical protein